MLTAANSQYALNADVSLKFCLARANDAVYLELNITFFLFQSQNSLPKMYSKTFSIFLLGLALSPLTEAGFRYFIIILVFISIIIAL